MTHEEFITRETAKLAKQAGFDWEVNSCYYSRFERQTHLTNYVCYTNFNDTTEWVCNKNIDWYSRPTQAVLQRWLREVKGYDIVVHVGSASHYYYYFVRPDQYCNNQMLAFDTYEAALEAGEQECLTEIIEKL